MRITSKGQVTIPVEIRRSAGLLPHTEVDFEFDGQTVRIVKAREAGPRRAPRRKASRTRRCAHEHQPDHGTDPRRMSSVLVDSNVLPAVMTDDARRGSRSPPRLS